MDICNNVIVTLSKNKLNGEDKSKIEHFLQNVEWDYFMGQIMFHKLLCRAYSHFINQEWLRFIPPTILYTLQRHYDVNIYISKLKKDCIKNLLIELNDAKIKYCVIKGLPLEKDLFADNVREYNDTDILINIRDLELANEILIKAKYKRGFYNSHLNMIETDRNMDVFFTMNTHQTLPYLKLYPDPFFKVEAIDLQFNFTLQKQLNYKINIEQMLHNRVYTNVFEEECYTLNPFDNFILLCTNVYGEAILFREIKKSKDLQIVKFADIYEWLEKYHTYFDWKEKIEYLNIHGLQKPVFYCLYILAYLYSSTIAKNIYEQMGINDLSFMDEYRDELFNIKRWKVPIKERIFKVNKVDMF